MAIEVIVPKIGFATGESQIAEWLVGDGDQVEEGTPLFIVEADKSANEIEAPSSGILKIIKPAGESCEPGTVIGLIE